MISDEINVLFSDREWWVIRVMVKLRLKLVIKTRGKITQRS